jgi:hypothetical protein
VFLLEAEDSAPLSATLQQLDRVTVLLFERDQPTSRLRAERAFLELDRDAAGRPSLREDKEIDLREAIFETLPGARLEGLRLELGNARILVAEDDIRLRTTTEDEPVRLLVAGERSGTLHGKGLQARLPRSRTSALRRADIAILRDPVLETGGIVVRAAGRMDYREDLDRGDAIVTLDDRVQLDFPRGGLRVGDLASAPADGSGGRSQVRGDRFTGWLQRSDEQGTSDPVVWHRLLLTGAPATVELDVGRLLTPRLSVVPGALGEPWLVTAHGGESRLEQTQIRPGSKQTDLVTSSSPRRIHLVRTGSGAGALHRSFGFPQWTLRPLQELQVVVFEGAARIAGGPRLVAASRGLHVFHRERSGAVVARGFGDVRIEQRAVLPGEHDLVATGNDGFELHAADADQRLRLGPDLPADRADPAAAWRRHHYRVQHGNAVASGVGACRLDRAGERTRLWLRAPGAEIAGRLGDQRVDLEQVRQLELELEGGEVCSLVAAGLPTVARRTGAQDSVLAAAPRMWQLGPRSLRLARKADDADPALWSGLAAADELPRLRRTQTAADGRTTTAEVRGPLIDVHGLGGDDVLVDAIADGDTLPVVDVELQLATASLPTRSHCRATRVRALPFALPREVRRLHTGGSLGALPAVAFAAAGQAWLVVDDVREFRLEDPQHGLVEGSGSRLFLSQGAQAALFTGDPDTGVPAEVRHRHEGRELTTRGARVRVFRERELQLQALRTFEDRPTFLLPSVTLHQPGSTALLSHMHAQSEGNIDVLPDRVLFGGPVTARGLQADGAEDPDGIRLDAQTLQLARDPVTGAVVSALGKNVRVDWTRLQARSAEVEFDVRRSRCIARDPADAEVVLPGGRTITAPRIEVNYETMAVSYRNGRMVQATDAGAGRR